MAELAFHNPYAASLDADGLPIDTDAGLDLDDEEFRTFSDLPAARRETLSGYLLRSPINIDPATDQRPWQRRWCVLFDNSPAAASLDFFEDEGSYKKSTTKVPKGRIHFEKVIEAEILPGIHRHSFVFVIREEGRTVCFSAPGKDEMIQWLQSLNDAIAQHLRATGRALDQVPDSVRKHAYVNWSPDIQPGELDAHKAEPWFYGSVSRDVAIPELRRIFDERGRQAGVFLVRTSNSAESPFALSWIDNSGRISHVQIAKTAAGFTFNDSEFKSVFPSLMALINSNQMIEHFVNVFPVRAHERAGNLSGQREAQRAQGQPAQGQPAQASPAHEHQKHPLARNHSKPKVISTQPTGRGGEMDRLATAQRFYVDQQFELKSFEPALNILELQKVLEDETYQNVSIPQFSTDWQGANMYYIQDQTGEFLFLLAESVLDTSCRPCLGVYRPFLFRAFGSKGPLFQVSRKRGCHCCCCTCFPCSMPEVVVTMNDWTVGTVRQPWFAGGFKPTYLICDTDGRVVLKIKGDFSNKPQEVCEFAILEPKGSSWTKVGTIHRKQKRMKYSMSTDADRFTINLPEALSVETKVTVLAAVLFLDFVQFEGRSAATTQGQLEIATDGDDTVNVGVEPVPWWPPCRLGLCDCFFCGCVIRC